MGYEASSGVFYTDVKTFTVTTSGKFRAIYVTWFRAYAEGVTMVWTNGQYVTEARYSATWKRMATVVTSCGIRPGRL